MDREGLLLYVNPAYCRLIGKPRQVLEGRSFAVAYAREHRAVVEAELLHRLTSGSLRDTEEHEVTLWNGTPLRFVAVHAPIPAGGRAPALLTLFHSLSAMHDGLEVARGAEGLVHAVIQYSSDVITIHDPTGTILFESPSAARLFGYPPGTLLGRNPIDFIHPDDAPIVRNAFQEVIEKRNPHRPTSFRFRHASGSWLIMESVAQNLVDTAGIHGILLSSRDVTEREMAAEALKKSEARLQFALEGSGDAVWDWSLPSDELVVPKGYLVSLGYAEGDVGTPRAAWLSMIHPEDRERVQDAHARHLRGEIPSVRVEYRIRRKAGTYCWILERGKLIERTPGGEPLRVVGTYTDISVRKRAEEALEAVMKGTSSAMGEDFFRHLVLDLAAVTGVRCVLVGELVPGKEPGISTLSVARDREVASNLSFGLAGTPCQRAVETLFCFLPEGVRRSFPGDALVRELAAESFMAVALCSGTGTPIGLVALLHDGPIAEPALAQSLLTIFGARAAAELQRLQAMRSLAESEEGQRAIIAAAPFGAHGYELRPDGTLALTMANPAAATMLGVDHERLLGLPVEEAFPEFAGGPIPEAFRNVIATGETRNLDRVILDGEEIRGAYEIHAFRTGRDRMIAIFQDITQRARTEEETRRARIKAEEASKLKSTLLSNVSHEFRTPITGILGLASLLREQIVDPEKLELVKGIELSARRLHATLDSIIKLAQFSTGDVHVVRQSVPLRPLLETVGGRFGEQARAKGLAFTIADTDPAMCVEGSPEIIEDILGYLVDNAVKYTPAGYVRIAAGERTVDGRFCAAVDVADSGIGVPAEHRESIFQEFRQLSEGYARQYEGNGLGLAVARRMVDALGGKITLESRDGKGSTFSVLLPLAPRAVDQPLQRRPRKDAAGPWPVLIVEDNFLNEAVMERFLQSLCNVDHARDGRSAVQMVQKKEYAAILMDINLGAGISGVEAAREIRRIPGYEQVPIIAVTGYALAGDRERLLAEGLTHYLPKPFDEHELLSVVTDALK